MSQQQGSRRRRQQLHPNSRSNPSSPSPTSSTSTSTSSSFEIIASPTHLPDSARSQPILKSASNGKEEHQQQTTVRSVAEMMFGGLKAVNNRFWEVDRKIGRWLHLDVREDEPDEPSEGEDSDNKIILDVDGEFENINNHHHYSSRHNIRNEHSQPARNQNPARNQPPPSYYHDNAQTTSSQLTLLLPAPPIPQTTLERLTSYLPIFPTLPFPFTQSPPAKSALATYTYHPPTHTSSRHCTYIPDMSFSKEEIWYHHPSSWLRILLEEQERGSFDIPLLGWRERWRGLLKEVWQSKDGEQKILLVVVIASLFVDADGTGGEREARKKRKFWELTREVCAGFVFGGEDGGGRGEGVRCFVLNIREIPPTNRGYFDTNINTECKISWFQNEAFCRYTQDNTHGGRVEWLSPYCGNKARRTVDFEIVGTMILERI